MNTKNPYFPNYTVNHSSIISSIQGTPTKI